MQMHVYEYALFGRDGMAEDGAVLVGWFFLYRFSIVPSGSYCL
jgi:hypothetical protein